MDHFMEEVVVKHNRGVENTLYILSNIVMVLAALWALLCVLSRWLNRYEAELPEGVMGGMGWRLRGPEGLRAK